MAYKARELKNHDNPYIQEMYTALQGGVSEYEKWRQKHLNKKDKKEADRLSNIITKFKYGQQQRGQ